MSRPSVPYLLFHPKFIEKTGHGRNGVERWEFQATRKSLAKRWWEAGCFVIDADLRRFELKEVKVKGVAWTLFNLFQSEEKKFLTFEHVFEDEFEQLTFDQAREIYVAAMEEKEWWKQNGEKEADFRSRLASYSTWAEVMEPLSLVGRYP